ncbi:MAG: hypothetical protein KGN74_04465, partial [Gemmatimonadota bacterium]|nr:hypothetical protein [Gemmatimonadota bacterium]
MRHRTWIPCLAATLIAAAAGAQSASPAVTLALTGTPDAPALAGSRLDGGTVTFDRAQGIEVIVTCAAPFSCARVTARADAALSRDYLTNRQGETFTLVVPAAPAHDTLAVALVYDGHDAAPVLRLVAGAAIGAPSVSRAAAAPAVPLALLVRNKGCANRVDLRTRDGYVLWLDGTPIASPRTPLVEGRPADFYLVGDSALLDRVRVVRTSKLRTVTVSNVLGAGAAVPQADLNRQGLPVMRCGVFHATFTDLAAGAAQIEISVLGDDGAAEVRNTVDFDVNALYTGAYTFGAIGTQLGSPAFGKVYDGADTVVSRTTGAGPRVQYIMTYTPFVWGPRDVTRSPARWYEALNPFVGIVLNDVPNNAVAGVSYGLGSMLYLIGGVHAAHVAALDDRAGVAVGQPFENRGATV